MANDKFLLYGGSGHAKVIADCLEEKQDILVGIFDDNPKLHSLGETPIIGGYTKQKHRYPLIISIGDNAIRAAVAARVLDNFGSVIHSTACVAKSSLIAVGTVVFHNSIVQVDCQIGKHVIINSGASIDHECHVDNFVHICPKATLCGNVTVGEGAMIGAAAVVIPGIKIGKWASIGAGAVVIRDVPDYAVVVGNPGRVISYS